MSQCFIPFPYRYEDPDNVTRKKNIAPVPAYENWIECQTIQELQAIRFNHNSIHMESLTIRERILTTKCPDVAHPIVFRGAVCADNGRFDRCESLWLHALELRQNNNVSEWAFSHCHIQKPMTYKLTKYSPVFCFVLFIRFV